MSIIQVGSGSYLTYVPPGQVGVTGFGGVPISPSVANDFTDAIPTNDWASSLAYHFFGSVSGALNADPIAMKSDSYGLNLSYTAEPTYIYDNTGNQVKYEYTFHQDDAQQIYGDLSVRLEGMNTNGGAVLEKASDYFVTANWQDSDSNNQLHATFGHGSPYVYYERDGNADVVIKANAFSSNAVGQPNSTTEVFQVDHVNGVFNGGQINMDLLVNAIDGNGSHIANAVEARISIDSDGDGKFDFVQTLNFFPMDGDINSSEHYLQSEGRGVGASTIGTLQNLNDASIKVEVWRSGGTGDVQLQTGDTASNLVLPFDHLSSTHGAISNQLFLDNDGNNNLLTATPSTAAVITLGSTPSTGLDIPWDGAGEVWYQDHNVIGITINGANYGLFAPVGSNWILENGEIHSDLGGKDYFSSALLPDQSVETLQYFYEHAFAFVTDSQSTFSYDQANAKIITNFDVTTELKEPGFSDQALTGLYRHQYINSDDPLTNYTYETARGEMKLLEGNAFTTETDYTGVLPTLPNLTNAEQTQQLYNLVDAEYQNLLQPGADIPQQDTYTVGKALERLGELTKIADQVGHEAAKTYFVNAIKTELEDWFTATGASDDKQFVYNAEWDTFQGYPASFESQKELNDHHFHYGYFINAAATVAQFDPSWVNQWGGMVDLLIQDVANTNRDDAAFPYLRNFDPYAGHSWANGHGAFAAGNNQESTSEAMNFANSLILWGAETHNAATQNVGIYLFSTELAAIQQYWFDVDDTVFPNGYTHNEASILWGDGATYSTFFGGLPEFPEFIHAIQFLPISGGSLYLGLDPNYAQLNYNDLVQSNGGEPNQWVNILMEYQALFDSEAAVSKLNGGFASMNEPYFESGDSLAHNYDWVQNFNLLGQVQAGVTADTPFFTVFNKNGLLTYTAYNPNDTEITVHFSDGTVMTLNGDELKAMNSNSTWSSISGTIENSDPTPIPDPIPDPAPDPVPDPVPDPTPDPTPNPVPTPVDAITGTAANDFLSATANNDLVYGLAGDDQMHGLEGNDTLHGGAGDDQIYGNVGDDVLIGGAGKDFLVGGADNDVYQYLSVSDSTTTERDFIQSFEQGHDKIDLSALNIAFDQLVFSQQNGYINIGITNTDFLVQVGGVSDFTENDFILNAAVIPDPTPDPVPDPTPDPTPDPVPTPVDAITGTAANDFLSATANNDLVYGLAGDDQMHGLEGNDTLHGGAGDDQIYGNVGDDVLIGGAGKDFLVGGDGNDVYVYEALGDSTHAQHDTIEGFTHGSDKIDLSVLGIHANDVQIQAHDGIQTLTVDNSDFSIDFIASDEIKADDIIT